MAKRRRSKDDRRYVALDVGGTKIQALLVAESGVIVERHRAATPQEPDADALMEAIREAITALLAAGGLDPTDLAAIGVAIAGVIDPVGGRIVFSPNMKLSDVAIVEPLAERFGVPVALGNDTNMGTLGERWLGAARQTDSAVGIFVGTGIGGGFVVGDRLLLGYRDGAMEIGHTILQLDGPACSCGNRGCFEALAGRWAIERDLRAALAAGRTTALSKLLDADEGRIRSGVLRRALQHDDPLVREVLGRASEAIGAACLNVRHLLDPELIVLGGGVIEACGDFMLPIVEQALSGDTMAGARAGGGVRLAALGDDAIALGVAALARQHVGRDPFDPRYAVAPTYPAIEDTRFGEVTIGQKLHDRDVVVNVNGKVKKRKKSIAREAEGSSHRIGPRELRRVCKGGPEVLFVGTGQSGRAELTDEGRLFLERRGIDCEVRPTPQILEPYNRCTRRRAAVIHVTC